MKRKPFPKPRKAKKEVKKATRRRSLGAQLTIRIPKIKAIRLKYISMTNNIPVSKILEEVIDQVIEKCLTQEDVDMLIPKKNNNG